MEVERLQLRAEAANREGRIQRGIEAAVELGQVWHCVADQVQRAE